MVLVKQVVLVLGHVLVLVLEHVLGHVPVLVLELVAIDTQPMKQMHHLMPNEGWAVLQGPLAALAAAAKGRSTVCPDPPLSRPPRCRRDVWQV